VDAHNLDFGFDPEMLLEGVRPTPKKKLELLKEIHSEFTEAGEDEDPKFLQLIMDENMINTFILDFVLVERAFSLRSFLKTDPRFAEMLQQLTTSNLALLLPDVGEEFGPDRAIDLYFSLSHSLIEQKVSDPKPSGFQVDRNGNFRFVFNFSMTVLVEKKGFRGEWEEARSMFVSLVAKGKVSTNEEIEGERMLRLAPKMVEIADIKIYNAADESMVVEEMMIKSGFNVQIEQFIKMVPPYEVPMSNPPTPPELECLGFRFADFDIFFRKGYTELAFSYQKVTEPSDPERCRGFLEALQRGPKNAIDSANQYLGDKSPREFLEEKKAEFEAEYADVADKFKSGQEQDEEPVASEEVEAVEQVQAEETVQETAEEEQRVEDL
jgi:hypothetical protein